MLLGVLFCPLLSSYVGLILTRVAPGSLNDLRDLLQQR